MLTDNRKTTDRERDERKLARMPPWVAEYLAAWGSKRPDGKRMTVVWASRFAGTNPDTVRQYRKKSPAFKRLEQVARYAAGEWAQSYVEAGLRGLAPQVMRALAYLIEIERHPQTVIKAMEWMGAKSTVAVEHGGQVMTSQVQVYLPENERDGLQGNNGLGDGLQGNNGLGDGLQGNSGLGDGSQGNSGLGDGLQDNSGLGDGLQEENGLGDGD